MNCPSCGAPLDVLPGTVEVVCPYCNTLILLQKEKIEIIGKQAPVVPFPTIFSIGKYFFAIEDNSSNDIIGNKRVNWLSEEDLYKLGKKQDYILKIYITGHIRCMNDAGFWDKWFGYVVEDKMNFFVDKNIMIQEDEGLITVFNLQNQLFDENKFKIFYDSVGDIVDGYFVIESGICNINGIEGQFSYPIYGNKIQYVDLKKGKDHYLVEKSPAGILFFKKI